MKGIILAGGLGTRLGPLTTVVSKQLLPVYDKPTVYYPLSTLIHAGVTEILIISNPHHLGSYEKLLGDGANLGIKILYAEQPQPHGIPQAIRIGEKFLNRERFWLILGDNLFHGPEFGRELKNRMEENSSSLIFGYHVNNPEEYGVIKFADDGESIQELVEKPRNQISNWAIPGIYLLDSESITIAEQLRPSQRGEVEMVDLLKALIEKNSLRVRKVSRGNAWFDLGNPDSLLKAANFVQTLQTTQGLLVGDPSDAAINARLIQKTE
jgi:glucose-1-phosphate thymidylyltransferase